jgi:3',5'-cyclic AMP phosphodiesterase CpdA
MSKKHLFSGIIGLCFLLAVLFPGCSGPSFNYQSDSSLSSLIAASPPDLPEMSFATISDLHYYPPSLGTEGAAFQEYITRDRKLLKESSEIMEAAVTAINRENLDYVFVTGDLTKDGEKVSHEAVLSYLKQIAASGKQVFVIPGNHDILNGMSCKYTVNCAERVPNITPEEFAQIYNDFGFKQAIKRDTGSLSYVAELKPGVWLLALDACRYKENQENKKHITDGKFSQATLNWIEQVLVEAANNKKAVIAIMHHNILEHYKGQEKDFGEYVLDDFQAVSRMLAMYNVRMVFTGHYHAQDITINRWAENSKFLFDIETGSLVTHPCPYRIVRINDAQQVTIRSGYVTGIKSYAVNFPKYTYKYTSEGIKGIASNTIQGYKVDKAEADSLADQVALAFMAHYAGDEKLPPNTEALRTTDLSFMGWIVVNVRQELVKSLWQDLEPVDNTITIDLKTGKSGVD